MSPLTGQSGGPLLPCSSGSGSELQGRRLHISGNQWGSSQSVHLALLAAGPLRRLWNPLASPGSLCSHLNQTPSITPALGSPAHPPTTSLVQGGNLLWKGPGATELELSSGNQLPPISTVTTIALRLSHYCPGKKQHIIPLG